MTADAAHRAIVDCGYAACSVSLLLANGLGITPETLTTYTAWAAAIVITWRLILTVLGMLGIQYPQRPIWTWGRRNGRD